VHRGGERWLDARDFFTGLFATALEPGELLAEIALPAPEPKSGTAFVEVARRHGDYAMAGVAARVVLDDDGRCLAARLVFLSVGDGPVDARRAAAALAGSRIDDDAIRAAAELASTAEIDPVGDIHASADFKRHLVRVQTGRALRAAHERALEAA
jgi:carbon-monoxide dehydrogenase medium subunit